MPVKRKAGSQAGGEAKSAKTDDLKSQLLDLLKEVESLEDEETKTRWADPFLRLVPKKQFPDYYEIIDEPISLSEITKKVKSNAYASKDEFVDDFELMLSNAQQYNEPESWIITGAEKLVEFVKNPPSPKLKLKLNTKRTEEEDITFGSLPKVCIALMEEVRDHSFGEDGILSGPFLDDVDLEIYPDYTQFVSHPTSFRTVISKLEARKFFSPKHSLLDNLARFAKEARSIFTNAQLYNDPESTIYQDAEQLLEYFNGQYDVIKDRLEKQSQARQRARIQREQDQIAASQAPAHTIEEAVKAEEAKPVVDVVTDKSLANNMGKTAANLPADQCVIQGFLFGTAAATAANVANTKPHFGQSNPARHLFPSHRFGVTQSLFDYKFKPTGYAVQSYVINLPPGAKPSVQVQASLHQYLYSLKRRDLDAGNGYQNSTSDEDFQCTLKVNEDEILNTNAEKVHNNLLALNYGFKLAHGLNVIEFEIKTAPPVVKKIKDSSEQEEDESGGRHTRHQFQQMKMSWDVEKITLYVNYNAF
ncbi:hypothetical protein DIURU_000998 [Diutina rugosa]|uniref:Bromo domain-containing protein n=1 Tax=Diutina rugosa TaxID=5481 RepID=A0A642V0S9_DIURU|nr:uncharacterized protein DIURU_000998 [Diutina rugosa]KAA8906589.1 hypothetical protein DIURU_000998 [Diutina rugosa]